MTDHEHPNEAERAANHTRRNKRIAAIAGAIAVVIAVASILNSVAALTGHETSVVTPGDITGPAETGPTETVLPPLVEPALIGTVTRSGAGCALEIVAEPIPSGAGRLSIVNDTNQVTSFDLFYLDADWLTFSRFEEWVSTGKLYGGGTPVPWPGAFVLTEREVGPGASGTIVDNFTSGDVYAVVCAHPLHGIDIYRDARKPIALAGPIVVP
jgi:hypothetical protein